MRNRSRRPCRVSWSVGRKSPFVGDRPIGREKIVRGGVAPGVRSLAHQIVVAAGAVARVIDRRRSGIVERAQHAGHIAKRRGLSPPLRHAAVRLALEIDDDHIVLGDEHLAEVIVAMDAGLDAVELEIAHGGDPVEDLAPRLDQRVCVLPRLALHRAGELRHHLQRLGRLAARRLCPARDVGRLHRLGAECAVVRRRRERRVELGRAPSERLAHVERVMERRLVAHQLAVLVALEEAVFLEVAVERLERDAPGVALVADEFEHCREGHRRLRRRRGRNRRRRGRRACSR